MRSRFLSAALVLAATAAGMTAQPPRLTRPGANAVKGVTLPAVGGAVLLADRNTLIVSSPAAAALIYFDTAEEKELKRVELEFKPGPLAVQGNKLFVGVDGIPSVRVFDPATAKETAAIKLPGEPVRALACHPTTGLVYGTTPGQSVVALDPAKGTAVLTSARGMMIAVDPAEGKYVYTGIQGQIRDMIAVQKSGPNTVVVRPVTAGGSAVMGKFEVKGADLKLVASNENAATNGNQLAVRPDGKVAAMSGGGGWREKGAGGYVVAAFETTDLKTPVGQMETGAYPNGIAFHPDLPLVAVYKMFDEVQVFSAKSLAKKESFTLDKAGNCQFMLFGAGGTKLVYVGTGEIRNREAKVTFLPLTLTDADKAALEQARKK
jgi:hypothetical protein